MSNFIIVSKLGSPNVKLALEDIARCREKMTEDRFQDLLKEFEIDPKVFDPEDDDKYFESAMHFFSDITAQAIEATKPGTTAENINKAKSLLTEWIEQIKEDPNQEPVKAYFQMLLAYVNKEGYQTYMENIPEELKEIFEKHVKN